MIPVLRVLSPRLRLFVLIFLCFSIDSFSQINYPTTGSRNYPNTDNQQSQDSIEQELLEDLPPDTVLIYSPFNLKTIRYFSDTTLHYLFHQYDAARTKVPHLNLGNFGSPHRQVIYQVSPRQGLDFGSHVLDLYKLKYEDIELIESKRPFTLLRLAQRDFSQQDLQFDARFHKTFQNGLHLNLDYSNLNYKGQFIEQINKTRKGSFSIWYHAPKGNYDFIINYLTNGSKLQDNGGFPDVDTLFQIPDYRQDPFIVSSNRISGRSQQSDNTFSIQNGFNLKWKKNTLGFTHLLSLGNTKYRYTDAVSQADSLAYYHTFYTQDTIDIHFKSRGIINDVRLTGQLKEYTSLMVGLRHELHRIVQSPSTFNLNLLFLQGKYDQEIGKNISINSGGQWGLLENFGEYLFNGLIRFKKEKLGLLEGHVILQRSPVPLLFKQVYSRNKLLFSTSFEKPLTNQIGGSLSIDGLSFKLGLDQSILSNTIFLDSLRLPNQYKSAISITSVYADKSFKFASFHSYHRFALQINTDNSILRLPSWYTQNTLYYQDHWFKSNIFIQLGLDARILPSFRTQSYFPLLGNFYNDARNTAVALHPSIETFFNFQLRNFRGFFKIEGLEYFIYPASKVFYETYDQPQFRTNMRFGFSWILKD